VAPLGFGLRLAEREGCVLAGVSAGALALSEVFMAFAGVNVEATRRAVGLSLWRPDLPWDVKEAAGDPVEYLPVEAWILGLGHLGQAYLWCLSLLSYSRPADVNLMLNDFDRVVKANLDTGMLSRDRHVGLLKGRVAAEWLEARGFRPGRMDRPFDSRTVRHRNEPKLGLCGFDGKGPRHLLDDAGFQIVVECGLGGTFANFDGLLLHTLPVSGRPAREIWSEREGSDEGRAAKLAGRNRFYRQVADTMKCGHVELAGLSVAVPFVGAVAGSLVMAETLRMLHGGERYEAIDLKLASPSGIEARRAPKGYQGSGQPGLSFQQSKVAAWEG
jgi:hypothetical protein